MSKASTPKPYTPHPIHRLYAWLDGLPVPMWLFYPLLLLLIGLLTNLAYWNSGFLPSGSIDLRLLFSGVWFVESLALGHYVVNASGPTLDGYREFLNVDEKEYATLKYEFTKIPSLPASVMFLLGLPFGIYAGISFGQGESSLINQLPALNAAQWGVSLGLGMILSFFTVRQMRLISRFFSMTRRIQLWNLSPIYAFSRYTAVIGIFIFMITAVNNLLIAPETFENSFAASQTYVFVAFALAIFYVPMRGINQRIIAEKEHLLRDVNMRLERMYQRIHVAEENQDYTDALGMRNLLAALTTEKESIENVPTWPWRPGTFATLLSALLLPVFLSLVNLVLDRLLLF